MLIAKLHISIKNQKLIFFDQINLGRIISKSHFPNLYMVSQITSQILFEIRTIFLGTYLKFSENFSDFLNVTNLTETFYEIF